MNIFITIGLIRLKTHIVKDLIKTGKVKEVKGSNLLEQLKKYKNIFETYLSKVMGHLQEDVTKNEKAMDLIQQTKKFRNIFQTDLSKVSVLFKEECVKEYHKM